VEVSEINAGRVAVITGAGNGLGRAHALAFATSGAKVVVNDLGGATDGSGSSAGPAQAVADEIIAFGGDAVASTDDISTDEGASNLINLAVETFGDLHVLVNNAGIIRDRMLVNMSEGEWDAVIAVHLKGTFGPMHHAAAYWREQSKARAGVLDACIVNTSSASGLFGNVGQSNYGAAKAGIAALSIIAAMELDRYGVRVNAIAPTALTRMTADLANIATVREERGNLAPEAVSPLVVYLGSPLSAPITGRVFSTYGGRVTVLEGWTNGPCVETDGIWEPQELAEVLPQALSRAAANSGMSGDPAP
jgi:NAD(P)-dependent dehydrogenase (short-subunit alcohol dehydrogenase family)